MYEMWAIFTYNLIFLQQQTDIRGCSVTAGSVLIALQQYNIRVHIRLQFKTFWT
jgi:hypothetical protein